MRPAWKDDGAGVPPLLGAGLDAIVMAVPYGPRGQLPRIPSPEDRLARYHHALATHGHAAPPLAPRIALGDQLLDAWKRNAIPVLRLLCTPCS